MQNLQNNTCQCLKISKALSTSDPRNGLLTPCIVVKSFLGDFNPDDLKENLQIIFSGFLASKECGDYDPEFVSELYFYHRITLKLIEDMQRSVLFGRINLSDIKNQSKL